MFNDGFRKTTIKKNFWVGGTDPGAESATAAAVVKPYQFRMSEVEGFRYRVTVSEFD